jgi:ATP-dependent helicase/nuclease subunit B
VPAAAAAPRLRRRLAHHAGRGLLGPRILTLGALAAAHAPAPARTALECRLLLAGALRRHRGLFPGQDNARVAEALFALFEEMTANAVLPAADEAGFAAQLRRAYGAPELAFLSREAQIVHRLWLAFRADVGERSPAATHLAGLGRALEAAAPLHLAGVDALTRAEAALIAPALREGRAQLWLAGRETGHDGEATATLLAALAVPVERRAAPPGALAALLDAAFDAGENGTGARGEGRGAPPGIRLVESGGAEHEARCVDLAVREALLAGARDIVVLTQDRRLPRRLRALLERANVTLHDPGGWALSTSRAAAALDAWLECIEGNFRFRPLLDLLKSGYVEADAEALSRLERRLIYHEGIEGGLPALIAAAGSKALERLLAGLQRAAFALPRDGAALPAREWTARVLRSLERAGLSARLQHDAAGAQLARLLQQLDAALAAVELPLRWGEFRDLLDGAIERETFTPAAAHGAVRLLTLEQAAGVQCELLVVAGASAAQLPGRPARDPFFNEAVRTELGLPGFGQRRALALARLRRALDGAGQVLITWSAEADDEPAQASPWVEAVEATAAAAGHLLRDPALARRAGSADTDVGHPEAGTARPLDRPAPPAPAALLPARLSATGHQALLDCPYKFFARSMLRLEREHAPDEDPDRSDYGRRVHRILQAFVTQVEGLPPPFTARLTTATRAEAQARLEAIADAVFARDLATRALAMTWAAEFRASIPQLLDWMSRRPPLREVRAEAELGQELDGMLLHGILDRLETRMNGTRVIVDYKTGKVPRAEDVLAGESVQLLHYALLDPQVVGVEYRPLRERKYAPVVLEAELPALREAARARLQSALAALRAGAPLRAQGDEAVCEHCDFSGLCRREDWSPAAASGEPQ